MAETSFHRRKADECIQAARLALEHELWETAVVRAYYCLYHLLIDVMSKFDERVPERGWRHDSLRKRFIERFCERSFHFNRQDGQTFLDAQNARNDADYHDAEIGRTRSLRTVARIENLRTKVVGVLDG